MRRAIVVVVGVLLYPPVVSAQDLTVDQMVSLALEESPSLNAARADIDAARGRLIEAGLRPNPMIGSSRREMIGGDEHETMVEVQWPLDLFRRSTRIASAEQAVEATTRSIADRERLLAAAVREQAGRALEAQRTLEVLRDLLLVDRQMRDLTEARVTEGAAPRLDLDILNVEVQRVEAQEALQVGIVEAALIELRSLVGLDPDAAVAIAGSLESAVQEPFDSRSGARGQSGVDTRPDVREAEARVRVADARLEERRNNGRIDASVVAAYSRMLAGFPQRAFDISGDLVPIRGVFNHARVGVMFSVPVWDRNQGLRAAASADRQRALHEVSASRLAARSEIAVAEARERSASRAVDIYGPGARELARRNVEVMREAYQLGSATLVEVLDEQRRYLDVEMSYTRALSEAYQARTALRRARGDVR